MLLSYTPFQLSLPQEHSDLAYYQALQKQSETQRILIHDIKNHLQLVHGSPPRCAKELSNGKSFSQTVQFQSNRSPVSE